AQLTQAAVAHSDDMVAKNFFDHVGSNGSTLGTRVTAAGYTWSSVGENIAAGQTSVAEVVDGWMKSEGHCANLMNAGFRDIGVACVAGGASNTYRTYWTQDFGTPR
ncbi:MAG: CAP domain-containing protein, partial [Rubrivivax sp.]